MGDFRDANAIRIRQPQIIDAGRIRDSILLLLESCGSTVKRR